MKTSIRHQNVWRSRFPLRPASFFPHCPGAPAPAAARFATLWAAVALLAVVPARAQTPPPVDCNCVAKLTELRTNACQAVIPDLCQIATNCFSANVVPGTPGWCAQTPLAGTVVGPGTYFITFTVMDNQGLSAQCLVPFTVSPTTGCVLSLLCASNKTVECGTQWSFDPPTWTNACVPPPGTVSNGVVLTVVSTLTNGTCPQVITRTWLGVDDCGYHDQCSQTVTVVDTTPPLLNCSCLTNSAVSPVQLTVIACTSSIPDLCLPASACAFDRCGLTGCTQSPPAGTPVGPGVYPVTVTVSDCASNTAACVVNFTVLTPPGGCGTNCVTPPPGMAAWWPLDEPCAATAFADVTGNGNAALVESGGPSCAGGSPMAVAGKVAGANYFYGPSVRGRALNSPSLNFGTGSFSADCWVNPVPTGTVHWHPVADKLNQTGPSTGNGYSLSLLNTKVVLVLGDNTLYTNTSLGSIIYSAWNFVAVSVDRTANTVTFHVNGVTEPAQTLLPAASFNSPVDLLIGGTYAVNRPYGELAIDELELFSRAITTNEIDVLWNAGSLGKCKPRQPCTNSAVSIFCPPGTNVQTCGSSAVVFYPPPAASTSCGTITNLVCVPPSGSAFPVGTNSVTCIATDSQGNSASCNFTITVTALVPWTVICPPLSLSVTGCPPVMPNLATLVSIVTNCPIACAIVTTQSIAPGTVLTPGLISVSLQTCDCLGNCQACKVTINAVLSSNCCPNPQTVLRLYSGATNSPPGVLPGGALDPQFSVGLPFFSTANPYVPAVIHWLWLANNTTSKWIGPLPTYGNSPLGVFNYTNRFFLCSTNQAAVTGRWTADDTGRIWLNGVPTANVLPAGWAFTNWHPVTLTTGFVPGWNELVFRVTNGLQSVTGLRTEITGVACCNQCVAITCPPNIVTNTCGNGVAVNYTPPTTSTSCGTAATVTCVPPPGSFFAVGTSVVTCTAIDAQGNAAACSFTVTVQPTVQPVLIKCPPNQVIYTCGSNAVAYYKVGAWGNTGPVICVPPSGSTFPLGTNVVTCYATNACGGFASCQFLVIVKPYPLAAPSVVLAAGLPDNFALPVDPASTNACLVASVSGFPYWKKFDAVPVNTLFGHRFTGLPINIVQAQLVIRMKPENDGVGVGVGSDNDGLFIGLTNCTSTGWAAIASIKTLPGAGGNWFPGHPATTFTNNLSAAVLAHMNSTARLDVMIHDDTTVDYMTLRLWTCPAPKYPHGLPHWTGSGTNLPSALAVMPQPELADFGPIGRGKAFCITPPTGDPTLPNRVQIGFGGGQAFGFTTLLDPNAPEGSQIVISVPTDDGTNASLFALVKGQCPPKCNWDLKPLKKFFDDGGSACRVAAVNTNSELLDAFAVTAAEAESDSLLTLAPEAGIGPFPVSFLFDGSTGEITVTFPGSVARRLCNGLPCPRGWDGTIKGRVTEAARLKGWDGTVKCPCYDEGASRVVFTPLGGSMPGPRGLVEISSTGLSELVIADERLYTMGGEVSLPGDAPALLQSTAAGDGVSFTSLGEDGGVTLDLGRSAAFDLGIHHFENGDLPTQAQLFRIGGPKWPIALTNRPPPPPVDLRLAQAADGVESTVDFTALGASQVTVHLLSNGVLVAFGQAPGPLIDPADPLVLDHWPERLGQLGTNGTLRLFASEPFNIQGFMADEIQFIPELPPEATPFEYLSEIQCLASEDMESVVYGLQRTAAAVPTSLSATRTLGGLILDWSAPGYRVLGAETLGGPWIELGVNAPLVLPPTAPQRFFRLRSD